MPNRRTSIVLLAVAALWACDTTSVTDPAVSAGEPAISANGGPASGVQLATGSGHVEAAGGQRVFTFHSIRRPDGSVEGSYRIRLTGPGLFFAVDVTCMTIIGNTAWVAGKITDTNAGFIQVGSVSYFYAIDNGEGGDPADVISSARINDIEGEDLLFCADTPLALPSFPIQEGNVQIR